MGVRADRSFSVLGRRKLWPEVVDGGQQARHPQLPQCSKENSKPSCIGHEKNGGSNTDKNGLLCINYLK